MIEIEIDGKTLSAKEGDMVIQVADDAGIYIPRYCYHKKLSVAANCRMCLVEVEKSKKPLPACATPVMPGMKVFTQSKMALDAQRAVMEFLLINHPLDCPICDQGGVCELQDLAVGFGNDSSRYDQTKRVVEDRYIGPLIETHMTRCIQCTRCVRFGEEIAGQRELGATHRGGSLQIQTFLAEGVKSELSGNMIDICPVGALTSRPFRFQARGWEMQQNPSVAAHDCVGSNIYIHTRGDDEQNPERKIMRVVPRENEVINETWISDRDRFSCDSVHSDERLTVPLIKEDNAWHKVDWTMALNLAQQKLMAVCEQSGAEKIAALISPSATLEEHYLLQKIMRGLGSNNIDHRVRQTDFSHQEYLAAYPQLNMPIAAIEMLQTVLLIGSYPRHEQPLLNHRLRKAVRKQQAKIICINPVDYEFNYKLNNKAIIATQQIPEFLAQIVLACSTVLSKKIPAVVKDLLAHVQVTSKADEIAQQLLRGDHRAIFLGAHAINHPAAAVINLLAQVLAEFTGATISYLSEGANTAGAWLAGAIPHRQAAGVAEQSIGLNAKQIQTQALKAYILFNIEPEFDCAYTETLLENLKQADCVILLTPYVTEKMQEYADVILPIATIGEYSGTLVNAEGLWQFVRAAALPTGIARPAWKVLRVLANCCNLKEFQYTDLVQVTQEIRTLVDAMPKISAELNYSVNAMKLPELVRVADCPMYRVDPVVRRALALQEAMSPDVIAIRVHPELAKRLALNTGEMVIATQNKRELQLPLIIDERIADGQVYIPAALNVSAGFGEAFGTITLMQGQHA